MSVKVRSTLCNIVRTPTGISEVKFITECPKMEILSAYAEIPERLADGENRITIIKEIAELLSCSNIQARCFIDAAVNSHVVAKQKNNGK